MNNSVNDLFMTAPLFQPSGLGSTNPFTVNSEDTYNANSLDTGFDTFAASSGPAPSGGGSGAPATNYYGAAPATSHFATTTDFVESAPTYRDRLKGLYVVARNFFLLLLNFSALPCLAVA